MTSSHGAGGPADASTSSASLPGGVRWADVAFDRDAALKLDHGDVLAPFRDEFVIADEELIYLDGNSLGRLSHRAVDVAQKTVAEEWGNGLVRSWHDWLGLPEAIGDQLAPLIGASQGEVILGDQTSINLFKLAWAGLAHSGRSVIIGDDSNFPSDRYVLSSVASALGGSYREIAVDPILGPTVADITKALDDRVGLICLSLVAFKSGALADLHEITALAHRHGALVLWDLSHAAGAIPVELNAANADLAVGCTYKHLNGGPGSPAFLYVRKDLQPHLQQPIPGWFGHDDMFAFEEAYRPSPGIRRFTVGTPPILSLRCAQVGVELSARAGIQAIRAKSVGLTEFMIRGFDERLAPLGFVLASPRDGAWRGGHLSVAHAEGFQVTQALISRGVIPDFRAPNLIRFGVAPLYNGYQQIWKAIEILASVVAQGEHRKFGLPEKGAVT